MADSVEAVTLKLAVLLRGGLSQQRALEQLTEEAGDVGETASRVRERIRGGSDAGPALAAEKGEGWKLLGATWSIAERTGAPIADALERMSGALNRLTTLAGRRQVLLAGPKGSVMLIASLPPVGFIVGELLGVRVGEQALTPSGMLLMGTGLLLLIAGIAWSLAMIRTVQERDVTAGFELELLWIALAGGGSPAQARRIVVHTIDELDVRWADLDAFAREGAAQRLLRSASSSGVPLRELLASEADSLREATHRELEEQAERLAVKLLLPLGLCILPSFICIGVIPVLLGLIA